MELLKKLFCFLSKKSSSPKEVKYLLTKSEKTGQDGITCLTCKRTSYNPNDVQNFFCGYCHIFHKDG